jgi:hypothetical protein
MTKKPFHQTFSYEICTKFLLFAKKSFKEFAGDFALFTIHFLPKFDETDARWQHRSDIHFAAFVWRKITKLIITRQRLKLEKKISTDFDSLELFHLGFTKIERCVLDTNAGKQLSQAPTDV